MKSVQEKNRFQNKLAPNIVLGTNITFNLKEQILDIVQFFQDVHGQAMRTFELHYQAENEMISFDNDILLNGLKVLLTKAKDRTTNGMIIVNVNEDINNTIISIKDSGSGFPENEIKNLLSGNISVEIMRQEYVDFLNVQLCLEKKGATLEGYSSPDVGSVFKILMPHTSVRLRN